MSKAPNILKILQKLDQRLEQPESLIICGGVAVTLAYGGKRKTYDLDVIAPLPLSASLKRAAKALAEDLGIDLHWLNDAAKGYAEYLCQGWEKRLKPIDLGLNKLSLQSIGKVDLLMMKLKASREKDIADIEALGISQNEAEIILINLERIAKFDSRTALNITLQLKEWGFV